MKPVLPAALAALVMTAVCSSQPARAQLAASAPPQVPVLQTMSGDWSVTQRMWTGPDAEPQDLPAAKARRTLAAGGGFIEEVMTLATPEADSAFTRTAHLSYNAVDGVFEYFSIDSRAPQQMHYQTEGAAPEHMGPYRFEGGTFVAAQWGDQKNIAFRYRVEITPVVDDRQELSLFLRPLQAGDPQEFRAFHYIYSRDR